VPPCTPLLAFSYTGKLLQSPQTFVNYAFSPDSCVSVALIYCHWHYFHTPVLFFKSYLETRLKRLEGFELNLLFGYEVCESGNVLIPLGDRLGACKARLMQCFQLISLFSVEEKGKTKISISFKLGVTTVFRDVFFLSIQKGTVMSSFSLVTVFSFHRNQCFKHC